MSSCGPPSVGDPVDDPVDVSIPDFLVEAMYDQAQGVSEYPQEDYDIQLPGGELSPELKEMFRMFTNVDVD